MICDNTVSALLSINGPLLPVHVSSWQRLRVLVLMYMWVCVNTCTALLHISTPEGRSVYVMVGWTVPSCHIATEIHSWMNTLFKYECSISCSSQHLRHSQRTQKGDVWAKIHSWQPCFLWSFFTLLNLTHLHFRNMLPSFDHCCPFEFFFKYRAAPYCLKHRVSELPEIILLELESIIVIFLSILYNYRATTKKDQGLSKWKSAWEKSCLVSLHKSWYVSSHSALFLWSAMSLLQWYVPTG